WVWVHAQRSFAHSPSCCPGPGVNGSPDAHDTPGAFFGLVFEDGVFTLSSVPRDTPILPYVRPTRVTILNSSEIAQEPGFRTTLPEAMSLPSIEALHTI